MNAILQSLRYRRSFPHASVRVVVCCSIRKGNYHCMKRAPGFAGVGVCRYHKVVFGSVRDFLWGSVPEEACRILSRKGDCPFIAEAAETCWCLWLLWKQGRRFEGCDPIDVGRRTVSAVLRCQNPFHCCQDHRCSVIVLLHFLPHWETPEPDYIARLIGLHFLLRHSGFTGRSWGVCFLCSITGTVVAEVRIDRWR